MSIHTMQSPTPGILHPYDTYRIEPTEHGLRFQVSVRNPRNNLVLIALMAKSVLLAFIFCNGFWSFVGILSLLLGINGIFYHVIASTTLHWIEVRPDGLCITPNVDEQASIRFFHRRHLTRRELDFHGGLTFRCGIYDVRATPGFANEREFELFEDHFEQAIARLWHTQNL